MSQYPCATASSNLQTFLNGLRKGLMGTNWVGRWSLLIGVLLLSLHQWPSELLNYKTLDNEELSRIGSPSAPIIPYWRNKIVIGLVSCPLASGQNSKLNEEAGVTIKSIVMSARIYGVSQVEFHMFLEDTKQHSGYFLDKLKEFGVGQNDGDMVDVKMIFHSAFDVVPKRYHEGMVYHPTHRCGFVRMFFASALPNVDSILYLDTDMIVTGNIGKLWERLGLMSGEQLVGVARNNEPEDKNYGWLDKEGFGDIPHVAPKGLNSGMMLMNLTRMREYGWEERLTRLYRDYAKIVRLNDQRLLNIMLYYDPGLLHLVPCQFDLMHTHCDYDWTCSGALQDPFGVHLIHGANDMFDVGKSFYHVYKFYLDANLTGDVYEDEEMFLNLVDSVRESYKNGEKMGVTTKSNCYGTLNRLLFKNLPFQNQNSSKISR